MKPAAFVLAGGRSSRMGRDKALLLFDGRPLVQHVANQAGVVSHPVTLVGSASRYANLGYPVIEDIFPGNGPLGGIHAALAHTVSDWNLILACDMPQATPDFLSQLSARAEGCGLSAVVPVSPDGLAQPLCAAYHRRCAGDMERALRTHIRKVADAIAAFDVDFWPVPESHYFRNLNTPEDWSAYSHAAG